MDKRGSNFILSILICPYLPLSALICPYLSLSALICPYVPLSALICPYLPFFTRIDPYQPVSTHTNPYQLRIICRFLLVNHIYPILLSFGYIPNHSSRKGKPTSKFFSLQNFCLQKFSWYMECVVEKG